MANENDLVDTVTVFIPDASLSHLKKVETLEGNSRQPYHWVPFSSANWVQASGQIADRSTPSEGSARFIADQYSTPDGRQGLRLRFFGVTPTARAYNGPMYVGP